MKNDDKSTVNLNEEPAVKLSRPMLIFSVATVYCMFIWNVTIRFGANTLYPLIQEDWALTDAQVGLLASAISLGMALFVLPGSYIADKWSRTKMVTVLGSIFSLGSLLAGAAASFSFLLFTRFFSGIGFSAFAPAASTSLITWFKRSIWGKVLGFYNTSQQAGVLVGFMLIGALATKYGWQGTFYILGAVAMVLVILSLFLPKQQGPKSSKNENQVSLKSAVPVLFKNKSLVGLAIFTGVANAMTVAMLAFMPIYFVRILEMPLQQAATFTGLTIFVGVASGPLAGTTLDFLVKKDRRARMWLGTIIFILGGLFYAWGFQQGSIPLIMVGAFFTSWFPTIYHTGTQELVPDWYRAASYGFVVLGLQGIGVLGPMIAGSISDSVGVQTALVYVSLGYLICGLGYYLISFVYKNDYEIARAMEADSLTIGTKPAGESIGG
ncbi:MFS family permease [Desulfitispora alkaliphila]|uniref:MFS transporter n=1 Tax=Desulfitispora alkaliphila TaxID=622674 RepID=UPI003D1F4DF4